jgi:hypothetical protein
MEQSPIEQGERFSMSRGQNQARRPATKFAHLQKKLGKQTVQKNVQAQREALRLRPKKGLP